MSTEDERVTSLEQAALAAKRRYVSLGLAKASKDTASLEGATPAEREAFASAERACVLADKALKDHMESRRAPVRD